MTRDPLIAGVDVGTTSIKAIIFEPGGKIAASASVPTPVHYPQPGWAYYEPEEIWQAVVTVLRQATGQLNDAGRVVSVAVASVGEAGVPLDKNGQPTYYSIAWFDTRTQPQALWLEQQIGKDNLFAVSGLSLQPIFTLCKILWLKENEPDVFARTVRWLNMADFIAYRLSGVAAAEYSLASRTLLLNLKKLEWDAGLIREAGLPPDLLAPLQPSGTPLGSVTAAAAAATGLPASCLVATGGHDHVCGSLATGVTGPGTLLNSIGTAEAIFLSLSQPLTDPQMGRQGYTQGAHVVAGSYYVLGGTYTAGACVEWWREIVGTEIDYATLVAEAGRVPVGSLGIAFLPHLRLANAPNDDPKGRGAFIGLNADAKRGALFRAILEGLAYEFRLTLEPLLQYAGLNAVESIIAAGGVTRNQLAMQIRATVINQTITVAEVTESTSLGVAILGGLAAGVYRDVAEVLQLINYRRWPVEPLADHIEFYNSYYQQVYRHIYPALRPLHHAVYPLVHQGG